MEHPSATGPAAGPSGGPPAEGPAPAVALVFGATGTAGSAVVARCLADERIGEVRAATRRPLGLSHPRLIEVQCADFGDLSPIRAALSGVSGCFFCLGASSARVRDADAYREITLGYAVAAAEALAAASPEHTFHFLSARGADPRSRLRWARVKAEAETRLAGINPRRLLVYRPAYIHPAPDRRPGMAARATAAVLRPFPGALIRAEDLALAMVNLQFDTDHPPVLDNREIRRHAEP
ncbi:NAD(P)H-binding protein [Streptodolium elevatio]